MTGSILNPADTLDRQNEKLLKITEALMRRVEQDTDRAGAAYAQFERAALLEDEVRQRTRDLERALELLNDANAAQAEASREAEAARANLSNAIEAVQEGFGMFGPDERLVMCNSRFGLHMPDVQPHLRPGLAFDDYIRHVSQSRELELPEGTAPRDWARQRRRRHQDSHVMFNIRFRGDRWLQVSEHRTPDGGTVVIQTDVTDLVRLEHEERGKLLDDQARRVRATLDHLDQGVCIFDRDARLVGWNDRLAALLSVPLALLRLGMPFAVLVDRLKSDFDGGEMRPAAWIAWARQRGARPPLRFELRKGPQVTLDVFAQEMPDRGFVISFTDVSAERQAARDLAEANELLERRVMDRTLELEDALATAERANASKSRFVAAASHDLLQPLSAAKLYMSSLLGTTSGTPAEKALGALESVESIIDALLDISKLDSGQARLDITTVSLGDLLNGLRDEFAPAAALKGLDLRFVANSAHVTSDPGFLRRILRNLIANAIRYTESGRVLVGARHAGNGVRVEVWDTGPGIPEADQDRIFNEFERLGSSASAGEGLGLGLAIVERACARLGHPLGLWSEVGTGTGFFVSLPRADAARSPAARGGSPAIRRRLDDKGLIVLLVESDAELSRAMSLLMERWGVSVLCAADATEAAGLLDEIGILPDAILVDHRLRGGQDGLGALALLQARTGRLPSRIFTADRSPSWRGDCIALGAEVMSKPIDTGELDRFLCAALDLRDTQVRDA